MRQEERSEALALGMKRIADYVAQQARAHNIGPVRLSWQPPQDNEPQSNRITLRVEIGAASRELALNRGPIEDYGCERDVAMTRAVLQELVRRLTERRRV